MPVYTLISFGHATTFKARDVEQLAVRLYRRTSWTLDACRRFADQLQRGVVCMALDHETVVLPGRFDHLDERPDERPIEEWWEPSAEPPTGGGTAADGDRAEPPLLTGGR